MVTPQSLSIISIGKLQYISSSVIWKLNWLWTLLIGWFIWFANNLPRNREMSDFIRTKILSSTEKKTRTQIDILRRKLSFSSAWFVDDNRWPFQLIFILNWKLNLFYLSYLNSMMLGNKMETQKWEKKEKCATENFCNSRRKG